MLNPYLNFPGTAEAAFNFYKSIFGGEFIALQRFKELKDMPPVTDAEKELILHIALPIGQNILMASDLLPSMGQEYKPGNNCYLSIEVESRTEADRVFAALADGGAIEMPMQDMFWGDYYGIVKDRFDIQWMISSEIAQN